MELISFNETHAASFFLSNNLAIFLAAFLLHSVATKSKTKFKKALIVFLQEKLSYDVPQIIFKKFNSEKKYINWINKSCSN